MTRQFEYKTIMTVPDKLIESLNSEGERGWELFMVRDVYQVGQWGNQEFRGVEVMMKRRRPWWK